MKTNHIPISKIFPLMFVLFVDALGMAILLPLLNPLFMDSTLSFLPPNSSLEARHLYYGITLALFPLAMLFSAPVLGDISDHLGRKKVLVFSLLGTFLSYLVMAIAIPLFSLPLFFLGRLVAGLTAGSQPIAQAAIIDISHPEHKAQNLSLIIGAMSFGWIGGPLLGGFLSDPSLVKFFSPAFSLFFAAALSLINFIFLQLSFKETLKEKKQLAKLHLHKGPSEFVMAFKLKNIRKLSLIFLTMQSGFAFYFGFVPLFLTSSFGLSTRETGLFLTFMAVGFAIPSFGLLKKGTKYLTIPNAAASAAGISGVMCFLTSISTNHTYILWPIATLAGLSFGSAFSYYLVLFSNRASEKEQGRMMGITTAIGSVAWVLCSLLGSYFANLFSSLPLILAGILFLTSSFFTYGTND